MALLKLFFLLMLLLPTAYQAPRGVVLLMVLLATLNIKAKLKVSKEVGIVWCLTFVVSLFSFLHGLLAGNPGALANVTVFLIWPTLYLYFMLRSHSFKVLDGLLTTLFYGSTFIVLFNFVMLLNELTFHVGFLTAIGELLNYQYNVGITEGFMEYNTPTQSLLPYTLYFSAILFLLNPKHLRNKKIYLIIIFLFSMIDILLSNRRAMWVVIAALPLVLLVMFYSLPQGKKVTSKIIVISVFAACVLLGTAFYMLDLEYVFSEISSILDFSGDDSNYERTMQFRSMFKDFVDNPLFGCGMGYVSSYIRTPDHPWEYELVYNYLLSVVGIIGFTIYLGSVLWIYFKSYKLAKRNELYASILYPQIGGLFSFLVINATNPYLLKFDFLWILFLPVVSINTILITSKDRNKKNVQESFCIS